MATRRRPNPGRFTPISTPWSGASNKPRAHHTFASAKRGPKALGGQVLNRGFQTGGSNEVRTSIHSAVTQAVLWKGAGQVGLGRLLFARLKMARAVVDLTPGSASSRCAWPGRRDLIPVFSANGR